MPSKFQSSEVRSPCGKFETFSSAIGSSGASAKSGEVAGGGLGRFHTFTTPSFELNVTEAASAAL